MPAKWKPFAFDLGQRVNVPGEKDVQGLVNVPRFADAAKQRAVNEQQFYVTWVADDGIGADGWFTAAELQSAQPVSVDIAEFSAAARRIFEQETAELASHVGMIRRV